ncbi:hypothetical protein TGME49_312635 [Toxoplasma gondii ME49]|uniref:Uncharacterized protein n=2 Tax=Toxoplasma gondii TaxID=5811 RepID=A0A125YUQ0_TOXGV|nr:hypothetical protein TGME49_312635 [Toxoplasma gondii ME49]EPT25990.1 hypothetical protein TGME49_312635 [Toxoplasma gondii ME49]ESS35015.1 hypothetical protein TGVEG_312635 [Toxoplasma gondii VEG]|eukprot:XP_018635465.1 hypothetical protein TGME49_312635 [Toxoplasma gondii ME49]
MPISLHRFYGLRSKILVQDRSQLRLCLALFVLHDLSGTLITGLTTKALPVRPAFGLVPRSGFCLIQRLALLSSICGTHHARFLPRQADRDSGLVPRLFSFA